MSDEYWGDVFKLTTDGLELSLLNFMDRQTLVFEVLRRLLILK